MKTRILMITHNRAAYTQLSLARLCESIPADAAITVWDNGSSQETRDVLKSFENHPRISEIVYNKTNDRLRGPTNWFWQKATDAEFISKVDDDGLMPDCWVQTLTQFHCDVPQAGVLGTWRFPDEDFVEALAKKKIQTFGRHQLLRNCWVEGSGYLMKRSVIDKIGLLRDDESFTTWCVRAAAAGYINGWYFPFLYQEHMDDPRAAHTGIKTDADFARLKPLSADTFSVTTQQDWTAKLKYLAWSLQACSYNPSDYIGWKATLRRRFSKLLGKPYVPRV